MFIENLTKDTLTYRAHGQVIKLAPGKVTPVENALVKADEVRRFFGTLVNIYAVDVRTEVQADEKEDIIEDNNLDTINASNTDGEISEESNADESIGEETALDNNLEGDKADKDNGEVQAEELEDEPNQVEAQEEVQEEQTGAKKEPEAEGKIELKDMKRPELLELAKELNLEFKGNISNANLITLIEEANK